MLVHTLHQFHENDLFTSAAAMSYFGLMALFPALLLLLSLSNKLAAGSELLSHAVDVYPGSSKFLRETIGGFSNIGFGAIITCVVLVLWAGSWVFAVIERALNRIWGAISRTFWHGRALTIGMVGAVGVLLSLSVLVTSFLLALREMTGRLSPRQIERYTLLASRRQCLLASAVCRWKLSDYSRALCVRLPVYAEGRSNVARHAAGRFPCRAVMGTREVHFRIEPSLLSLRSDLWICRRCRSRSNVELRFQLDPALRRPTHSRVPLRASFSHR